MVTDDRAVSEITSDRAVSEITTDCSEASEIVTSPRVANEGSVEIATRTTTVAGMDFAPARVVGLPTAVVEMTAEGLTLAAANACTEMTTGATTVATMTVTLPPVMIDGGGIATGVDTEFGVVIAVPRNVGGGTATRTITVPGVTTWFVNSVGVGTVTTDTTFAGMERAAPRTDDTGTCTIAGTVLGVAAPVVPATIVGVVMMTARATVLGVILGLDRNSELSTVETAATVAGVANVPARVVTETTSDQPS